METKSYHIALPVFKGYKVPCDQRMFFKTVRGANKHHRAKLIIPCASPKGLVLIEEWFVHDTEQSQLYTQYLDMN